MTRFEPNGGGDVSSRRDATRLDFMPGCRCASGDCQVGKWIDLRVCPNADALVREMATIVKGRWDADDIPTLEGIVELLTDQETLSRKLAKAHEALYEIENLPPPLNNKGAALAQCGWIKRRANEAR